MGKKTFIPGVLFALVLGLCVVTGVPAGAGSTYEPTIGWWRSNDTSSGTAEYSTAQLRSTDFSVHLEAFKAYSPNDYHEVYVANPTGVDSLSDINNVSFWYYCPTGGDPVAPLVDVWLDLDDNYSRDYPPSGDDEWLLGMLADVTTYDDWVEVTLEDINWVRATGGTVYGAGGAGLASALADLTDLPVLAIGIETGGPGTYISSRAGDQEFYVDDLTINSSTYAMAPRVINTTQTKGYNEIQPAIDAANAGDTINVAAGTYDLAAPIAVNKSLTLTGDTTTPSNVMVNAPTGATDMDCFQIKASDVTIQGFTMSGAYDADTGAQNAGVMVGTHWSGDAIIGLDNITISNNEIYDCTRGIYVYRAIDVTISDNKIHDTVIAGAKASEVWPGKAIELRGDGDPTEPQCNHIDIFRNEIYNCELLGIEVNLWEMGPNPATEDDVFVDVDVLIDSNVIHDNGGNWAGVGYPDTYVYRGISCNGQAKNVTISNNEIYGHTSTTYSPHGTSAGIRIDDEKEHTITGNYIHDNYKGIRISKSEYSSLSGFVVNSNDFKNNITQVDDSAEALNIEAVLGNNTFDRAVAVDHPGASLLHTIWSKIQEGIDAAVDGDTVNVAPGMYNERITITKPLMLLGATHDVNKNGYPVPEEYAWDETKESIIMHPNPGSGYTAIVDIYDVSDVIFRGFVIQELHATGNADDSLLRVRAQTQDISGIDVSNNIIGPFTNTTSQDGTHGRMGLYLVNNPYNTFGIINSTFSGNKIFHCKGNGNNIFIWSSYKDYGAGGPASMAGTVIEDNEIYGAHRSGIETAGGFSDLTIRNNGIYGNGGPGITGKPDLMFGNGIIMIRGSGDRENMDGYGPVDITLESNDIHDNDGHGIYMGPNNAGITIKGNTVCDNGKDGILVDLIGNYWNPDFETDTGPHTNLAGSQNIAANFNNIYNNIGYGVQVIGEPTNDFELDVTNNWWGSKERADVEATVSGAVKYEPWTGAGVTEAKSETVTDDAVDAKEEADTEVIVDGSATVTVAEYSDNPGTGFSGSTGKYIDVHADDTAGVNEVVIKLYYTDAETQGLVESSLRLRWWNGTRWVTCSDSGVNTTNIPGPPAYSGYMWAKVRNDTTPNLTDLSGAAFGGGGTRRGGGGGGGGGGGAPPAPPTGTTDIRGKVSTAGVFTRSVTAISEDELCALTIPKDTVGLTYELEPLDEITMLIMDEPPSPPEAAHIIGLIYDLGPDGATFYPPVTLEFSYDPQDIPEGIAEEDLAIAYYDEDAGEWVELEGVVDTENDTITAPVEHFTAFGAMFIPTPAAFSLSELEVSPAEVDIGETVTISAAVENTGGQRGSYKVTLKIDGVVEAIREVTLNVGASEKVTLTTSRDVVGSYSVDINGLTGSFTVKEEAVLPPEDEQEPIPEKPTSSHWPLIGGIVAAVVVVAGLFTFFLTRRRATT